MINRLKTFLLMSALIMLFLIVGEIIAGRQGAFIGLIIACFLNITAYWKSDKLVLSRYNAISINEVNNPRVYNITRQLAENANLPMPQIYLIPEQQPNAFATGRNPQHSAVAVTSGLVEAMDDNELSGVIAHELGHIKNRDILISTIAAVFSGAISFLTRYGFYFGSGRRNSSDDNRGSSPIIGLLVMILAPIAALIVQMGISRKREFLADEFGAKISGNPLYLRNALQKLESYSAAIPMQKADIGTAHMFIINPFANLGGLSNLFKTHPSTQERIKRLEDMANAK